MKADHAWMKAKMPIAPMADEQSGTMIAQEDPQLRCAVDPGRVDELVGDAVGDVLAHQEDAEAHDQVGRGDALIGVDPAERLHREVERDHVGLEREHRGREDHEEQQPLARELVLAEDEAGEERRRDDHERRAHRDDEAVEEVAAEGRGVHRLRIVLPGPVDGEHPRRPEHRLAGGLKDVPSIQRYGKSIMTQPATSTACVVSGMPTRRHQISRAARCTAIALRLIPRPPG